MTAVEWLSRQLQIGIFNNDVSFYDALEQAKKMEKQQIIDAFHKNSQKWFCEEEAEQYYNETFKNK